jgi:hypothetical protein
MDVDEGLLYDEANKIYLDTALLALGGGGVTDRKKAKKRHLWKA